MKCVLCGLSYRAMTVAPIAMRFGRHMVSLGMQKVTLVMLIKM